jgi:divalent metal cation (Fe/Co/Zn/Cd) transporter
LSKDARNERNARELVQNVIALASVAAIGVGCWWLNPAYGLIVPAVILLAGVVYGRTH